MVDTALTAAPAPTSPMALEPIIAGFYPDPTVCRVGEEYFLANSSFEYFPGVPIFRSTDLLSWTQVANVLSRGSQFQLGRPGPSRGIYAPTLRHHDGRFWLITTNISDELGGQILVTATAAAGPWSDPVHVRDAHGIDPDLCWDEDGTCFITWKELDLIGDGGEGDILQAPLDTRTGELLELPYPVWQGTGMMAAEGPHLYRIGDYWYIMLAEGGTERGHSVTIARGPSPRGPYEPCPENPILSHRSTSHPIQNVGHADLVQTASGEWAAVFLGTRPMGSTPGFHTIGRETFVAGIDWVEGWPVFDVLRHAPGRRSYDFVDDFTSSDLDLRWVTPNGDPMDTTSPSPSGGLILHARGGEPALCVRVRDLHWMADAAFEQSGVFQVRMDPRHWYGIRQLDGLVEVGARIGDVMHTVASVAVSETPAALRIESRPPASAPAPTGHGGPDDIVLSFIERGQVHQITRLDGRYLSTEVAAGFTGRMLAVAAADDQTVLQRVEYRSVH